MFIPRPRTGVIALITSPRSVLKQPPMTAALEALAPHETTESSGKREAILAAALELFTERGFHGTAMPLVAERAGVGAGTIYRHFESKEALVNALYQSWKEFLLASVTEGLPAATPLREQFHIYWNRLATFAAKYPVAFTFLELHFHAPYLDAASRLVEDRGHNALIGFYQECARQGVVKELPPEALASMVWGAFVGMVKASQHGCLVMTQSILDQVEACCWQAVSK
jgi:TetR/AcrR family transcriptional regulator, repressor of fatR-cypB operon